MRLLFISALVASATATASAQIRETPVAFDSAARILSVGQAVAGRLQLDPAAWPVKGDFVEAKLYQTSAGGYVITVARERGVIERFPLDDAGFANLRAQFQTAIDREGKIVAEDASTIISESARGPFARDQMLLATVLYGPSLATLTHDPSAGAGAYLLTVGSTFFLINDFARRRPITKAQNALTTDGALRGWAASGLLANTLGAKLDEDGAAITALVGGLTGSVVGYNRGKRLTHAEAQAAMTASTLTAGAAAGLGVATGLIAENRGERLASGVMLAGGIAGYLAGPMYPRRVPYTVTAGDIGLVRLGAILGTAAAITPFVDSDIGPRTGAAIVTAGWLGGAFIGDRVAAKPFNHSTGDMRTIYLGTLGGALIGAAPPVMSESDNALFTASSITGGAILGAIVTQRLTKPSRQGAAVLASPGDASGARIEFSPEALAMAAMKTPGKHPLLRIRF